ncbi:MAG: site-specific DNA-methyltransferase [Clostridium sp.]|nr:site-specific DNA-methyltransferase [Clostridium sp.]
MKLTIIGKVHNLLKIYKTLKLKDMYEHMPEHTPAAIRGAINRYLKTSKEKVFLRTGTAEYKINDAQSPNENTSNCMSSNLISLEKFRRFKLNNIVNKIKYSNLRMVAGLEGQMSLFDELSVLERVEEEVTSNSSTLSNTVKPKQLFGFESMLNKVMNMDAIKFLKSLPDKCVDLLVTDPPYPVISGGTSNKKGTPSGMLSKNDGKIFEHNDIKLEEWIPEVYRIMKDGTQGYIMTNLLNLEKLIKVCQDVGFKIHNLLVWKKNNATPNRWYMKNCEYTLFVRKGKAKPIIDKGSMTVHEFKNIIGDKLHPTEKPLELMNYYVQNSVVKNGVLLEPFAGVGSTIAAGVLNGMKVLSSEIDKAYHKISQARLDNVLKLGYDDRNLLFNL